MRQKLEISIRLDTRELERQIEEVRQKLGIEADEIEIEADADDAVSEAEDAQSAVDDVEDRHVDIDGDSSEAVDAAGEAASAVEDVPDQVETRYQFTGWREALPNIARVTIALGGVVMAYRMITNAISSHIERSNVQEDAEISLRAALRNTGLEVERNFQRLTEYASAIQSVTRYGDEAILSSTALMQNIGELGENVLPMAQRAAVGLAAKYRMELNTAFMLVGRAAKGQTQTLTRYGIVIDENASKEEQFQQLLREGADAFSIAEDEARSGAGALEQYQNLVGDLSEKLGDMIKAVLLPLVKVLTSIVQVLNDNREVFTALITSTVTFAGVLVVLKIRALAAAGAFAILQSAINPLYLLITGVVAGLATLGIHLSSRKMETDALSRAQREYDLELENTIELTKTINREEIEAKRRRVESLRKEEGELTQEIEQLQQALFRAQGDMARIPIESRINNLRSRLSNMQKERLGLEEQLVDIETEIAEKSKKAGEEYYEELRWAAEGYYDFQLKKLKEEREERIASGIWTIEQAEEVFEHKKALLDEEREHAMSSRTADIEDAKRRVKQFFDSMRSERQQLQSEFEEKKSLIETAFADDPEKVKEKVSDLNEWYEKQMESLRQRERESERADYMTSIQYLEAKRNMGFEVAEELRERQNQYFNFLKERYGRDSFEYQQALKDKLQAEREYWREQNKVAASAIDAVAQGTQTAWGSILDTTMSGSERIKAIWGSMRDSFMNAIGQMLAEYVRNKLTELAMTQTVEGEKQASVLKTVAVEMAAYAKTIPMKIQSAFATIAGAIAEGFKWLVSTLGPLGLGAGIGLGAAIIAAFKGLIGNLGFSSGGYTGKGGKEEPAGVVHRDEVVFESEITKKNLSDLLGLRALLQKGYRLKDLMSMSIPAISLPQPSMSLASGGVAGGSLDFTPILNKMDRLERRLHDVEKAIGDQRIVVDNKSNLVEVHRVNQEAKKEYESTIR
jgi:hypothetical protein